MWNFKLTRPCDNCPFRTDIPPYLNRERATVIANDLQHKTFECHKSAYATQPRTVDGRFAKRDHSHCAGALIIQEKTNQRGDMQQIAQRLGLYDPGRLDMTAPVFSTFLEWIKANT